MIDNTITKLPDTGELCVDITEFGLVEDHLSQPGLFLYLINERLARQNDMGVPALIQ